jgi:MSHA pilin protein MshD
MGTGQMMLTIGAMLLLSTVILNMNNIFLSTTNSMLNDKLTIVAASLAESKINHAKSLDFDEKAGSRTSPNFFTSPGNLGVDGEVYSTFDDFDDYNNYMSIDTVYEIPFNVECRVEYINIFSDGTSSSSASQTYCKKMTVKVTSQFMMDPFDETKQDTIQVSSLRSWWE